MKDLGQKTESRSRPWIRYVSNMTIIREGRVGLVGVRHFEFPNIITA